MLLKSRFIEMFEKEKYPVVNLEELIDKNIETAKKDFSKESIIKYIDISSIDNVNHRIIGYNEFVLSDAPSRAQQHIRFNDILVSTVRPNLKNVARVELKDSNLVASSGFCVLRPKKCSSEYLLSIVKSDKFTLDMSQAVSGATYPAIKDSDIYNYKIKYPPKEIQNAFSLFVKQLDKSKFLLQQMIAKLELLKKSRFIEMFGCIGKDEKQWGLKSLKDCVEVNPQKSKDPLILSNSIEEVSFVPMAFVGENGSIDCSCIKNYDEVKSGFTYFKENDVLFAKITPCMENGKGCIAKGLHNGIGFGSTEFHVLRPLDNLCNPKWLYYVSTSQEMRRSAEKKMTGSAGQRRVPAKFLEDFKISIPPIELQKQFATFVSQVDKSKAILQKQLDDLVGSNK